MAAGVASVLPASTVKLVVIVVSVVFVSLLRAACAASSTGVVSVDPAVVVTFTCFSTVVSSLPLAVLCSTAASIPLVSTCTRSDGIVTVAPDCTCMPAPLRVPVSIPRAASICAMAVSESTSTFARSTFTPSAVTENSAPSAVSADIAWSMAAVAASPSTSAVKLSMEIFSSSPA